VAKEGLTAWCFLVFICWIVTWVTIVYCLCFYHWMLLYRQCMTIVGSMFLANGCRVFVYLLYLSVFSCLSFCLFWRINLFIIRPISDGQVFGRCGDWLLALPVTSYGLRLANEAVGVALHLGCSVCVVHTCRCGAVADAEGIHGLVCKQAPSRIARHQAINDVIARVISSSIIPIPTSRSVSQDLMANDLTAYSNTMAWGKTPDVGCDGSQHPCWLLLACHVPLCRWHCCWNCFIQEGSDILEHPNRLHLPVSSFRNSRVIRRFKWISLFTSICW